MRVLGSSDVFLFWTFLIALLVMALAYSVWETWMTIEGSIETIQSRLVEQNLRLLKLEEAIKVCGELDKEGDS